MRLQSLNLSFMDHDFLSAKAFGLDHSFADLIDYAKSRDTKELRHLVYGIIFDEFHGINVVSVENYRLSSVFRPSGIQSTWGVSNSMATARAALSAPVWPPDMILVSMIGEITGCFEEIQGI